MHPIMRNKRSKRKKEKDEHRKTQFSSQIKAICWLVENCLSTKNHRKIEVKGSEGKVKSGKEKARNEIEKCSSRR